ncbi:DUF2075 domain-containing protein [Flavobacterium sp. SUN046]|uniref:DUF2075 domain-containing protein n=1 Tax=Flavobacterium sp. SUN046 TaxID=3002440 RepID=UPI002DBA0045|nr:DUF2075 domain-containing protein [Flavobacterium sp. SUN046]MEC4048942.1 DUF2075 domain-containing protein [Flavobacterium sp. SUN046]
MTNPNRKVIYSASQDDFFKDILFNRVADIMKENQSAISNGKVGGSEFTSWTNSPRFIKDVIEISGVKNTHVTFEYQVPYSQKRIDCMLYGVNDLNKGVVIHIELKQWDKVTATNIEGNFVETYTGIANNRVAHPSQQVKGYHDYLMGFVEVFEEDDLGLYGCSYCHNYIKKDGEGLHDPIYHNIINEFPIFSKNEIVDLANILKEKLSNGDGFSIFNKFMQSPIKPSRKLLESAANIVKNESDFTLLNDQIVARNIILSKIRSARKNNEKSVIVINGGPGTGKTIIALHILAEIAASKTKRSVFFSTKSKPLLEGIKNRLEKGNKAKILFNNLNQFIPSRVDENSIDLLLIDEAHRIGKTSNHQYTKAIDRTDLTQVATLIRASKVSVFFIDDKQAIRSAEIGSTHLIKNTAIEYDCSYEEVELVSQFRCNGSDNYLDWLESTLGHSNNKLLLSKKDNYDFKIFDNPTTMYNELLAIDQKEKMSARIVAGFCWEWSKTTDSNGDLIKDVKIGDFEMPWETHGNMTKPPVGYVHWYEWAYKDEGIKQVGCIYTAQGFEFDYIGVIVGNDLMYDPTTDSLIGNIEGTKDPMLRRGRENFDDYVKNIYRVLMTRGMKGCYVYFVDKEVEKYFKNRIDFTNT